jgi:hypothetical protein
MLRKTAPVLVAVATALSMGIASVPASASAVNASECQLSWGSGPNSTPPTTGGHLTDIRAGQKECYDRLVFDLSAEAEHGFTVSYVDHVSEDATGAPVPLRGGAILQITLHAPAYDEASQPTYQYENRAELVDTNGFQTFRQVAWAGSWEGTTVIGLGVRAQLPYRVFAYDDRVVVDVAHTW